MNEILELYLGDRAHHFERTGDEYSDDVMDLVECKGLSNFQVVMFEDYCVLEWLSCSIPSVLIAGVGGDTTGWAGCNWYKKFGFGDPGSVEQCNKDVEWILCKVFKLTSSGVGLDEQSTRD